MSPRPPGRIGIFGGTFDPIHVGHLVAAINARYALSLDKVLMVVASRPWQKTSAREVSSAADRYAVVEAAVSGVEGLEASALEIERGGNSYTVDTLEDLAGSHPGAELYMIVGSDLVRELETWERAEDLPSLCRLVVVSRPGAEPDRLPESWRTVIVDMPGLDISSTDLRTRAAEGRPLDFLIPPPAVRCIRERGMYAMTR